MSTLKRIALTLVIIGAINWGLIGLFRFDLVAAIFGGQTAGFSRIIYTLVGISGLISLAIYGDMVDSDAIDMDRRADEGQLSYGTEFSDELDIEETDLDEFERPDERDDLF